MERGAEYGLVTGLGCIRPAGTITWAVASNDHARLLAPPKAHGRQSLADRLRQYFPAQSLPSDSRLVPCRNGCIAGYQRQDNLSC